MPVPSPFRSVLALAAMLSGFQCAYVALAVPSSGVAELIVAYAFPLFLILWMDADARQRRCVPCHDFGFLLAVTFPLSLVWYVFWSRGPRGSFLLLLIGLLWHVPWMCATLVWRLKHAAG